MDKINNSYSVNFTSLKPQKRLGEEVLREFNNEMGYLESSSNLALRIVKKDSFKNKQLLQRLEEKQQKLNNDIYDSFICKEVGNTKFKTFEGFKSRLVENIKGKGNKANCWEDMLIVFIKLLEKGEKPSNVEIKVSSLKYSANHFTTVIGLKKDAEITDPTTWGSKALIVDAWAGIVKPATEALEDIKTKLLVGEKIQSINYKPVSTKFVLQSGLKN